MELTLQLKTVEKRTRPSFVSGYRSYHLPVAADVHYEGFYYIGKNTDHIEKLVKMYSRGYATEGLENVKNELLRNLNQDQHLVPEVIICEACFATAAIKEFAGFLRQHPVLRRIPFILDCTGVAAKDLDICKKTVRPDEVIFLHASTDKELKSKVGFLRKVKVAESAAAVVRIEENLGTRDKWKFGPMSKRVFDILVASVALLLLSPLLLLIALAIKLESRGPIIYNAKRAGRGYRIFNFYKFRTMHRDADKRVAELNHLNQYNAECAGPVFFKISNDPRITRVGSFLRNTSLDELPQLINVLLGDMSLVGNRPLPLYEAATLTTDDYAARFLAPAGITGLWQVKKRGNRDMSVEERINLDIDYATKCNFATDFWIIANTPSALLQKESV
jgi:lipopolysaccharide/colanic/teichoic acid biosynthesis glycosyltransferase